MASRITRSDMERPVVGFPDYIVKGNGTILYKEDRGEVPTRGDGRGYVIVTLKRPDGTARTIKVHRVVWHAFNPNVELSVGDHIDHIDHDKTNNRISNLRLRDASENSADCRKTSRKGMRVLTTEQRRMVATLCCAGFGTKEVAVLAGIGETTVRRIKQQIDEILGEGSDATI